MRYPVNLWLNFVEGRGLAIDSSWGHGELNPEISFVFLACCFGFFDGFILASPTFLFDMKFLVKGFSFFLSSQ